MNKFQENRVKTFLIKEMSSPLSDLMLLKDDDNEYFLFNKYYINKKSDGNFEVNFIYGDNSAVFTSLKNAVCYCIFDKSNKLKETRKIQELDTHLASIDVSISQLKKILRKAKNTELKLIYLAKLSEELQRKKNMKKQLSLYLNKAKYMQATKFRLEKTNN